MLKNSREPLTTEIIPASALPGSEALLGPVRPAMPESYAPASDWNIGQVLAMLMRHKWLAMFVIVLVGGTAVPAIWLLHTPNFQTTASIRVRPIIERIVFATEKNGQVPLYDNFVNTQVSVIRSPLVLSRVLNRDDIKETAWFKSQAPQAVVDHDAVLENMLLTVKVGPRRGTELVDVSVGAAHPAEARLLADAIVDEYLRYVEEQTRAQDVARSQTLEDELLETESLIDGTIASIHNVSEGLGSDGSQELRSQAAGHLKLLEGQRDELQRELGMTRWELQSLRAAGVPNAEGTASAGKPRSYALDGEWRQLKIQQRKSENELKLNSTQYGEYHPRMRQLAANVQHARDLLTEREAQLDGQLPGAPLDVEGDPGTAEFMDGSTLGHLEQRLAYEIQLLDQDIERYRKSQREAQHEAHSIAEMQEDLRRYHSRAHALESRREILDIESKAPARISVAYYAMTPSSPHQDRRLLLSVMALMAACGGGLGVAYLRGSMDQTIRAASDVHQTGSIPFLGQVPELPRRCNPVTDGNPQLAENIRMVRTALLKRIEGSGRQSVLITSSMSHNGKTSISILLARSLAQLGKRVLLVEGDLRKPSLAQRLLDREPQVGLARLLNGTTDDAEAIIRTGTPRLDILPAGELPAGFDFEKLANGLFRKCLARWKLNYDLVLLDSPPVLPVADARILAGEADGTVMVLRASHCARGDVLKAYTDIAAAGGQILGTVMVGGRPTTGYGQTYGYGVTYGELPGAAATAEALA